MKIVAVIPAYNEEKTIADIIKNLKKYVDEIIVVDDASNDKTYEIATLNSAKVIKHKKNRGYDKSIEDGFSEAVKAKASIIITFDADGQHLAGEIPKITEPLIKKEADIVVGIRPKKQRFSEKIFSKYSKKKIGVNDPLCGLKGYSVKEYKQIGYFDSLNSIGTELLFNYHKHGFKVKEVKINSNNRNGKSRFGNVIQSNIKILRAFFKVRTKFR